MFMLLPQLDGRHVRLEPLQPWHAPGLAEAAAGDPALYQLSPVPQGEAAAAEYIEAALAQRDAGTAAPFAGTRLATRSRPRSGHGSSACSTRCSPRARK